MKVKYWTTVVVALVLALAFAGPTSAQDEGRFPDVTLKVECSTTPKQLTVTNDSDFSVTVTAIAGASDPGSMQNGGGETKPVVDSQEIGAGESQTYQSPDEESENLLVILVAKDTTSAKNRKGRSAVALLGCTNAPDSFQLPGGNGQTSDGQQGNGQMTPDLPETGAGGMAAGSGMPVGGIATAFSFLAAGGYAVLRRR